MEQTKEIISRKDIIKTIAIILSNWYFLVIIPTVMLGVSYVYTHQLSDVYVAKCQILLKANETYDYQEQIYKGLGFKSGYASYEETASQMRVIQSSGLIEKVLESLPLDVSYFIIGRLKVTEIYKHVPFKVVTDERSYANSGMEFQLFILDTNQFRLTYNIGDESKTREFKFGELILGDGLYLKIEKEPNLNSLSIGSLSQINYMFRVSKEQRLINKYQNAIEVSNIDYTSIVEIALRDEIQERAIEVLDTLSQVYIKTTLESKTSVNDNTLVYIDRQLDEVIGIINDIEKELEIYKEEKKVLNLGREEESYFAHLIEIENLKRAHEMEISALEDLTTYLLQEENDEALLPPNLFVANTDPELSIKVKELYTLRESYSSLLSSNTSTNPKVLALSTRINELKSDIIRYIETEKTVLLKAIDKIEIEIGTYEGKIKGIPKTQRQILHIQRRLMINEELYSYLLSKRAETVIARAAIIPQTKIIERSRGGGIVFPNKQRINIMFLLAGLGLAILIVIIKVSFFHKIKSLGQLQTATELSLLGSIPRLKQFSKTYRILSGSEKSELAQSFRMLRTNLQYFAPSKANKTILVTSILPGEGKTFTSVNLASVMAIAEKKVLIMDFDLHKPRLARAMELDNSVGVSSILVRKSSIDDAIQKTQIPTLDVITSGPIPPNASELILKDGLDDLLEYARTNYDYVFLDTPPVSLISDGLMLMGKVDVKLFVLNSKSTTKTSLDYLEKLIKGNHLDFCSLILNEEEKSRIDYYYSRYGYGGYGYGGYGYGGYGNYGTAYSEDEESSS